MLKAPLLEGLSVVLSEIQHFVYLPSPPLLRDTDSAPRQQAAACSPPWRADCEILTRTAADDFLEILLSVSKEAFSSPEKRKKKSPNLTEIANKW